MFPIFLCGKKKMNSEQNVEECDATGDAINTKVWYIKIFIMNSFKILFIIAIAGLSFTFFKQRPVLYIIGDSTVRNGDGRGGNSQWGWGSFLADYFDTTKVIVENDAIGGRSSRTFITEGRWDRIRVKLKKGDFVIMQFGHNDG